jgi:hypothetical protein
MARFTRRHLLLLVSGAALFSGARYGNRRLARAAPPDAPLSDKAKALIARAWQGLDPKKVVDVHVHVAGVGYNNSGCYVGERLRSKTNPIEFLKYSIYQEASGVEDDSKCEVQWIDRLAGLVRTQAPHGRVFILAFDEFHTDDGKPDKSRSEFYTPNSYVTSLAKSYPDLFVPVASVHPYRADAVDALE